MVKHIVLWKLKDHAAGGTREQNRQRLQALLEALPGLIPEIKSFEVGAALEPSEGTYDLALYSAFVSLAGLKHYQEHPEHQKVAQFSREVASQRAVVDYEK